MPNPRAVLDHAFTNQYGIPAMCCYNVEGIIATVRAAEAKRSPAMILLAAVLRAGGADVGGRLFDSDAGTGA